MKNFKIILIISIMSLILVGCQQAEEQVPETVVEKVPVLTSELVEMDFSETYLSIGQFEARDLIQVYTGGVGEIERLMVFPGEVVTKGQILFTLNKEMFERDYKIVESNLRTIRDNAKTRYEDTLKDFEEKSILYGSGALAKTELDQSRSQLTQSKKTYQDAVTSYNNQTATLKEALDDRIVVSPIDGRVGTILIAEKDSVQNIPALEIINDDELFVKAMVTGKALAYIAQGDKAQVFPDGDRLNVIKGVVESYNIIANETDGLFEVHILVDRGEGIYRTGEYAEVQFLIKERTGLGILRKSVLKSDSEEYVYIIEEEYARKKAVETGVVQNQYIEILSGLNGQERIVIQGQSFLNDGALIIEEQN